MDWGLGREGSHTCASDIVLVNVLITVYTYACMCNAMCDMLLIHITHSVGCVRLCLSSGIVGPSLATCEYMYMSFVSMRLSVTTLVATSFGFTLKRR